MGKLDKMLDMLCLSSSSNSCFYLNSVEFDDEFESKPLIASDKNAHKHRLEDVISGKQTLSCQLKPKVNFFFSFTIYCSFFKCNINYSYQINPLYYQYFKMMILRIGVHMYADNDIEGVHALPWMCKKS